MALRKRLPQSLLGDELRRQFALNVRLLRIGKGLTQRELAKAAGLGRVFINQVERGHNSATLETIAAIAAALGERPAALIGGSPDGPPQPIETTPQKQRSGLTAHQ